MDEYLQITGDNEITYQDDEDEFYRAQFDGMNTSKIDKVKDHGKQIEHTHLTEGFQKGFYTCFLLSKNRLLIATKEHLYVKENYQETDKFVNNPAIWKIVASAENTDIVEKGRELYKDGI
jgi:hypothetical protein